MKQFAWGNLCGDEHRVPTDPTFYFIDFWNAKAFLALDNALRLGLISLDSCPILNAGGLRIKWLISLLSFRRVKFYTLSVIPFLV